MRKLFLTLSVATFAMTSVFAQTQLVTTGTINKSIPTGWTYITNNPQYPNPDYYTDGALKLNFENMGIESPEFASQASVEVKIKVSALNENTKTAASDDVFTVTGYNGATAVAVGTLTAISVGDNTVALVVDANAKASGITSVKVVMTGYPYNGSKYCNVGLASVTVSSNDPADNQALLAGVEKPSFAILYDKLVIENIANGSVIELYNMLGQKVKRYVYNGSDIDVSALPKGIYMVRTGQISEKIVK